MTTRIPEHSDTEPVTGGPPGHPTDPSSAVTGTDAPASGRKDRGLPPAVVRAADTAEQAAGDTASPAEGGGSTPKKSRAKRGSVRHITSPWQRSHSVWHRSGVDWSRKGADASPGGASGENGAAPSGAPRTARAAEESTRGPEKKTSPRSTSPRPSAPRAGRTGRVRRAGIVVVALVLVGGAGAYAVRNGEDGKVAAPGAVDADRLFTFDPAAKTDGRDQTLTDVVASGETVVALGSDEVRGQFLTSVDGGRTWRVADVRADDGGEPPPGEFPRLVAGGAGAWVAFGGPAAAEAGGAAAAGRTVGAIWTSRDGRSWIRRPGAPAFGATDDVRAVVRTASGFVAVGRATGEGAVWLSPDGRTWQRVPTVQAKLTGALRFDRLAAVGDTLVTQGFRDRTVVRTVTQGTKKRRVTTTVRAAGHWRSTDGGRTWAPVTVPQKQGSSGAGNGLVSGPGGFVLTRDAQYATGKGERRKLVRTGVVFGSADGAKWTVTGRLTGHDLVGVDRLSGGATGFAALVRLRGGDKTALMRSPDGRKWSRTSVITDRYLTGLAMLSSGPVVAGRAGDDAYLSLGSGSVDLAAIEGAALPDRAITALAPNGEQVVAVGGTNGDAAAWLTRDGRAWSRATGTGFGGDGTQRLTDVTGGGNGWVAVGRTPDRPLVMTSDDGTAWRRASGFSADFRPTGATYGPSGYVLAGKARAVAATWRSTDLKKWTRGSGELDRGTSMRDVATTPEGYVAVGAAPPAKGKKTGEDAAERPMAWTSADGAKWSRAGAVPVPPGAASHGLTQVVANGGMLVALAGPAFVATSEDGGRTWQSQPLQGASIVAAAPEGFVAAGTVGAPGRSDVVLWSSPDGRSWRSSRPRGTGLDGDGAQRLTALTALGDDLLAVGVTGDHRGDRPTLWRTPAP
ncbi:hypothetical protein GCM10009780_39530 [Actinomadura alba]